MVEIEHWHGILFQHAVEHGLASGIKELRLKVIALAALPANDRQLRTDDERCVTIILSKTVRTPKSEIRIRGVE